MTDDNARKDIDLAEKALHEARDELTEAEKALERAKVEMNGENTPAAPPSAPAVEAPPAEEKPAQPIETPVVEKPAPETPPSEPKPAPAAPRDSWRVEFNREECIGAGACVAANASYWSIDEDGKATLQSATYDETKKVWVLDIADDDQLQKQRDAAGVCPVNVIHIIDPSGKKEI